MDFVRLVPRRGLVPVVVACVLAGLLLIGPEANGQKGRRLLRIGTSGTLGGAGNPSKEEAALKTLKSFIREETGLANQIIRQKDWRELADKMARGKLDLGVFQGEEFAWAKQKHHKLEPLALAVNVHRYPVAYVVTKRDAKARDFAGLKGKSLTVPSSVPRFIRLYLRKECEKNGADKPEAFFSKVKSQENVEDALDDVVDGVVAAAAVDRAALESFKRRKPARFKRLHEVARSMPFPPPVIAYYGTNLDETSRRRFRSGLLRASTKEKGRMMLTLFRLTRFDPVPKDFAKVVARVQKDYPPPDATKK